MPYFDLTPQEDISPPLDYRGLEPLTSSMSVPNPNRPQAVDPYAQYDELLNGPATQALMRHLGRFPAEQKPSLFRRVLAGSAGASAGWEQGPMAGLAASEATLNIPENRAISRWSQENVPLQQAASLEARRAAHILDPLKLMETSIYHQGMLQRPLNLEELKQTHKEENLQNDLNAIDVMPGLNDKEKSMAKVRRRGGGTLADSIGSYQNIKYVAPDNTEHVVRVNSKHAGDPIFELGPEGMKEIPGVPADWRQLTPPQTSTFVTGAGNLGVVNKTAAVAGRPGAVRDTGVAAQIPPAAVIPDVDPTTQRSLGTTIIPRKPGEKPRYVETPTETKGASKPYSESEKVYRDTILSANEDLKVVEKLSSKLQKYIGIGGRLVAGWEKFTGTAPKDISDLQAAAGRLKMLTTHPLVGSALTPTELDQINKFSADIQNFQFGQDFMANVRGTRRWLDTVMKNRGMKPEESSSKSIEELRKKYPSVPGSKTFNSEMDQFIDKKVENL